MKLRKICKKLLFVPLFLRIVLVILSVPLLVASMTAFGSGSVLSYVSYALSAYTLTVWCFGLPFDIRRFKSFKRTSPFVRRWHSDERFRVNSSLYGSLGVNALYAAFQLWLGFVHHTFWFYSLAGYYILLAVMRFLLLRYTLSHKAGEDIAGELKRYRACGWVLLVTNAALALIVFFMVYWDRTFYHHEITAIAMAAYTFTAFVGAIVGIIKHKQYSSPVYSAARAVSLIAAAVSMLTLSSTMLTTFSGEDMTPTLRKAMLGSVGGAVSVFVLIMAIYMIAVGTRKIKEIYSAKAFAESKEEKDSEKQ